MAPLYRKLADRGAVFHYVSSSPWQLYPPLRRFFDSSGLPVGSFHLRSFRLKDESFLNLFKSSRETKPGVIEALLAAFPRRDFVLVGDSGEADPEIYGDVARRYPGRVRAILIRNVTGERADDPRFGDGAFRALPLDQWLLFEDAAVADAFLEHRL
jgi:phosphatidate phosphatase APP1